MWLSYVQCDASPAAVIHAIMPEHVSISVRRACTWYMMTCTATVPGRREHQGAAERRREGFWPVCPHLIGAAILKLCVEVRLKAIF